MSSAVVPRSSDAPAGRVRRSPAEVTAAQGPESPKLDADSLLPLWAQIAAALRQRISSHGTAVTGLSDQALAREFGVSPLTARQAVQDLVNSGLVTRHRGKGTFVVSKPAQGSVDHLESVMSEWRIQGRDVRIEVLQRSRVAASIPTAAALQVDVGEIVTFLHRRRVADGHAVGVDYRYIRRDIDDQLDATDVEHETLWEVLENKLGMHDIHANVTIRATTAQEEDARLLGIAPGAPVLDRGFQLVRSNAQPVLIGHSIYHPERFIHATTIRRRS